MKKVIWISGFALVFLILAVITSVYTLNQAKDAIAQIQTVSLSEDSKSQIDNASEKYFDLESGFGASILFGDKVDEYVDFDKLEMAQEEYVSKDIMEILELEKAGTVSEEEISNRLSALNETIATYYSEDSYETIDNFDEIEVLSEIYLGTKLSESEDA